MSESDEFLVVQVDRSGLIQGANRALERLRAGESGGVTGMSLLYLVNAEDRPGLSKAVREVFAGGAGGSVLARLLTDGKETPAVRWTLMPVTDEEGAVEAALCIGADLTPYLEMAGQREKTMRELQTLRNYTTELEKDNARLRRKLDQQKAAAQFANDAGPIPGLEEDAGEATPTLAQLERRYIIHTLKKTGGRVSGAKGAASLLGMHPNTLRSRMQKFGIVRLA